MKRKSFAGLVTLAFLLFLPIVVGAQRVYLNNGWKDGQWDKYELEMGHKSAPYIYSYTFNSGILDFGDTDTKDIYFRIKIEKENNKGDIIIAPSGDTDVNLSPGEYTDVPSEPNKARSYHFVCKKNTTYTIRLKWDSDYEYRGLKVAYYEASEAPSSVEGYPPRPRLISTNPDFNNKAFTKAGPNYFYYDLDLTGSTKDLDFKFYTIADKEYLGCDYKGFKEVDKYSFNNFYWPSNELGPNKEVSDDGWRNEYFTLKHSTSGIKKYRINLWKDQKEEAGNAQKWKFYIQNMDINPDEELYFVSPELTDNKRLPEFRMSPSRRRDVDNNGNYDEVITHWSFNLPDFVLDSKHRNLKEIHYHLETANGEKYTVHNMNDNYELGFKQTEPLYPATDNQGVYTEFPNDYDREKRITKNIGNVVRYERYDAIPDATLDADGHAVHNFLLKRSDKRGSGEAQNGTSYTWLFNRSSRSIGIYVNTEKFGKETADAEGYHLLGNFGNDDSAPYNIEIQKEDYAKKMDKSYYKGGNVYTGEIADADSIVYSVTISRPVNGWKKGGYTLVVAPTTVINKTREEGFSDWGNAWAQVIRPQERCDYFYKSETLAQGYNGMTDDEKNAAVNDLKGRVEANWTGLNATALHGGLYARKDDAKDDVQQTIMVFPNEETRSFTFYMNLKTSTYWITKQEALFIMGPAVGSKEEDRDANGWSEENSTTQTDHAYKLTYNETTGCYMYFDKDGKETPVPMAANKEFAFKVNKTNSILYYAEDEVAPKNLAGDTNETKEALAYSKVDNDADNNTQYVNFLKTGNGNEGFKPCTFGLPSKTEEGDGYYIRLYPNEEDGKPFYTIRRAYTFSTPQNPKNSVGEYKSFKTFSDYHAVELPEGVDAFYISSADKENRIAKLTEYPCRLAYGKKVLPAGAAVILATTEEGTDGTDHMKKLNKDMDYFYEPNFKEEEYEKAPTNNMLKSQITRTLLPTTTEEGDNFLFSFQKKYETDENSTIGFFVAGKAYNPINTAYLQVEKGFLGGSTTSAKGWTLSFDFDDTTGIQDVEAETRMAPQGWYTLQGMKISKPLTKGIYICNGRKVIVK